jgi:glycosidase
MKFHAICSVLAMSFALSSNVAADNQRPVIYQLMVRTFGNTNETRKVNGTMAENGCGKFNDLTPVALKSIRAMGFTHVWLTGVLEQASGTSYEGREADPPDILKGIAGSPYAIRDYFDVCPDYAEVPERRLEEFRDLLERCRVEGLKVIIDFVPNHVARSYGSDVRPDLSFGKGDERGVFFARDNHFYYLGEEHAGGGAPLRLPTAGMAGCTGRFAPETEFGRVTGNNVISWEPSINDWYETVKLSYGHDFTKGRDTSQLPGVDAGSEEVPRTWRTMDAILGYWQEMGVDGFRVDMAHMVPMEFWAWSVKRARERKADVFFSAEAYDNDPAKLTDGHVLDALLDAGFDAVYDDPSYDVLEGLYDSGKWMNDLDALTFTGKRFHRSLRYGENHDEVRLASPKEWGGLGMKVGRPVCAVLYGMGRGPIMMYHGQEVGEPAAGEEGFGGDDARTTIFDYWSMPEFVKWVNGGKYDGGRLNPAQRELREWYRKLIGAVSSPAFTAGEFYGLNHANKDNEHFGRLDGETVSGHWLYAFLRHDRETGATALVVANFHGDRALEGVRIRIPDDALRFCGLESAESLSLTEKLADGWSAEVNGDSVHGDGISIPAMPPCSARIIEIKGR